MSSQLRDQANAVTWEQWAERVPRCLVAPGQGHDGWAEVSHLLTSVDSQHRARAVECLLQLGTRFAFLSASSTSNSTVDLEQVRGRLGTMQTSPVLQHVPLYLTWCVRGVVYCDCLLQIPSDQPR
jgi:hypothetical protein